MTSNRPAQALTTIYRSKRAPGAVASAAAALPCSCAPRGHGHFDDGRPPAALAALCRKPRALCDQSRRRRAAIQPWLLSWRSSRARRIPRPAHHPSHGGAWTRPVGLPACTKAAHGLAHARCFGHDWRVAARWYVGDVGAHAAGRLGAESMSDPIMATARHEEKHRSGIRNDSRTSHRRLRDHDRAPRSRWRRVL